MVQIVPPPDWRRGDGSDSSPGTLGDATGAKKPLVAKPADSSPAVSKSAADAVVPAAIAAAASSSNVRLAETPRPSEPAKQSAIVPPALPPRKAAQAASPVAAEVAAASEGEALPAGASASPEAPVTLVSSVVARVRRDGLLLGGGLLGGVTLGAVVWLAVWMTTSKPATFAAAPASKSPANPAVDAASESKEPQPAPINESEPPAAAEQPGEATPTPAQPAPDEPVEPFDEVPADVSGATPPPTDEAFSPQPDLLPAEEPAPALRLEPVATTDSNVPLDGALAAAPADSAASVAAAPDEDATPPVEDAVDDSSADDASAAPSAPLASAEIEQRLSVSFKQVEFAKVPLRNSRPSSATCAACRSNSTRRRSRPPASTARCPSASSAPPARPARSCATYSTTTASCTKSATGGSSSPWPMQQGDSSLLKNAVVAFFNLTKCEAKLRTARKITTCVAILRSRPCDHAGC